MSESLTPYGAYIARHLRAGAVLHKYCDFFDTPKNKFLVVVSTEPRLLILFINSKINDFYKNKNQCHFHVPIPVTDHDFLKYDSFANCVSVHDAFDYTRTRDEVIQDYNNIFMGFLTDSCLENVYLAVSKCNVLVRKDQREILASIKVQLPHL